MVGRRPALIRLFHRDSLRTLSLYVKRDLYVFYLALTESIGPFGPISYIDLQYGALRIAFWPPKGASFSFDFEITGVTSALVVLALRAHQLFSRHFFVSGLIKGWDPCPRRGHDIDPFAAIRAKDTHPFVRSIRWGYINFPRFRCYTIKFVFI